MTSKAWTWSAVMATILALAAPTIFAIGKRSGNPVGVPPDTVADYLRSVIMATGTFPPSTLSTDFTKSVQEAIIGWDTG